MKPIRQVVLITAFSLLGGGIFFAIWLAVFLAFAKSDDPTHETLLWVLSPSITAIGFTLGALLVNRILKLKKTPFLSVYFWPLVGCVFGAILVYWYGPMLIVFSMLAVGTLSIFLKEIRLAR